MMTRYFLTSPQLRDFADVEKWADEVAAIEKWNAGVQAILDLETSR